MLIDLDDRLHRVPRFDVLRREWLAVGHFVLEVDAIRKVGVVSNRQHVAAIVRVETLFLEAIPQALGVGLVEVIVGQRGHILVLEHDVAVQVLGGRATAPLVSRERSELATVAPVVSRLGLVHALAPNIHACVQTVRSARPAELGIVRFLGWKDGQPVDRDEDEGDLLGSGIELHGGAVVPALARVVSRRLRVVAHCESSKELRMVAQHDEVQGAVDRSVPSRSAVFGVGL